MVGGGNNDHGTGATSSSTLNTGSGTLHTGSAVPQIPPVSSASVLRASSKSVQLLQGMQESEFSECTLRNATQCLLFEHVTGLPTIRPLPGMQFSSTAS